MKALMLGKLELTGPACWGLEMLTCPRAGSFQMAGSCPLQHQQTPEAPCHEDENKSLKVLKLLTQHVRAGPLAVAPHLLLLLRVNSSATGQSWLLCSF